MNGDLMSGAKADALSNDLVTQSTHIVTDQNGSLTNLTVKFHYDETGNVQLTTLDSNTLLDLSEFLNHTEGQCQVSGITLTPADISVSHLLSVTEQGHTSTENDQDLTQNLMLADSDSGRRLLAGNHDGAHLLVSGSMLSEVEESNAMSCIMLEGVDPQVVLGSQDKSPERSVSVITSRHQPFKN